MAQVSEFWANVGIGDSRQDITTFRVRLVDADAAAWFAAVGYAAKAATDAGVLMDAVAGLSAGNVFTRSVENVFVDDAAVFPDPDDNIYNFDKINVGYRAALDRYTVTIPSRDDDAYNVGGDGVTIIITGAGASAATTAFVAAFNTSVEGKNGSAGLVEKMYISR